MIMVCDLLIIADEEIHIKNIFTEEKIPIKNNPRVKLLLIQHGQAFCGTYRRDYPRHSASMRKRCRFRIYTLCRWRVIMPPARNVCRRILFWAAR